MSANEIVVRLGRSDERQAFEALQERAALADESYRQALLAHSYEMTLPIEQIRAGQVFVAELSGVIAGVASVVFRHDGDIELDGLFVEPGVWLQGVGRALIERCVRFVRDAGAHSLYVTASYEAAGFYTACGFETLGAKETEFAPALDMQIRLAGAAH